MSLFCRSLVLLVAMTAACAPYPREPHQTLQTIEETGVLWVGVSEHPPWTESVQNEVLGVEPNLVRALARELDVEVRWMVMSETELVHALEQGEVHLGVAGLTKKTPWSKHVGLSKPYVEYEGHKHVVAVRKGENRWLLRVERFLEDKAPEVLRDLDGAQEVAGR